MIVLVVASVKDPASASGYGPQRSGRAGWMMDEVQPVKSTTARAPLGLSILRRTRITMRMTTFAAVSEPADRDAACPVLVMRAGPVDVWSE